MNAPQPVLKPSLTIVGMAVKDLRREPAFAPGGTDFPSVTQPFLPIIYGLALKLLPENPGATQDIVTATLQCFGARWRKLPKSTLVGPWLVRAAYSIALRARKRLRLPKLARGTPAAEYNLLFKTLWRLKPFTQSALILRYFLPLETEEIAAPLGFKASRLQKLLDAGVSHLSRKLRKTSLGTNVISALAALPAPVPTETESAIAELSYQVPTKDTRTELTRTTLISWRWLAVRTFFKRVLATVGGIVCVLGLLASVFGFLASHGFLDSFFIRQQGQQMARDFPELTAPAGQWPVTAEDRAYLPPEAPRTSAALYQITNIWAAKLTLTPEQMEEIQPTRVSRIQLFQDNRIILRNPNAKRSGLAGALGYEFDWVEADFEFAGLKFDKVAARFRGNGTYVQSLYGRKQSFKVDLNKFTKKQSLAEIDELNFVNAVPDFSYVRDALAEQLFRDLGVVAPRTAYAYLSIDVPGKPLEPLGLYVLIENIDKNFAEDRFGTKKTPIFKPVTYDLFIQLGTNWNDYAAIYDLKTDATPEQLQRVIDFSRLVTHASDDEFAQRLPEFLDIEETAAFVAGHTLLSSYDGFFANGQNFYLYLHPRTEKFGFISWDQDHSWGEFGYIGTAEQRERADIWHPAVYDFVFLKRTLKVPAFRDAYKQKLENALAHLFTTARLYAQIDQLAAAIRPAIAAENSFRLKRFDQSISSEWLPRDQHGPAEGPNAPVHQIKRFIENRIKSVRGQLDGTEEGARLNRWRG